MARVSFMLCLLSILLFCFGCSSATNNSLHEEESISFDQELTDRPKELTDNGHATGEAARETELLRLYSSIGIIEDYRSSFQHGVKTAEHQKYIMLHDTEGDSEPGEVINWWDSNGNLVAAHFIIGTDGSVVQCVPMDAIAHHAGFGDIGHNDLYGVAEDARDDRLGTVPIGDSFPDYGMNSYSVGIELVHIGGSGYYPQEQLDALDKLIAYIDVYYGFESQIIDHKAWRSGNSDTSPEFAVYLANYQIFRNHSGA